MTNRDDASAVKSKTPLNRIDGWIIATGQLLSGVFLISAGIIFFEIIARYVFNSPTSWVHETTTLLCALLFAFGGSHCLAKNSHIRIGLVYEAVSPKIRRYLDIFISFMTMLLMATMSYAAWILTEKSLFTPWGEFRPETSGSAWDPPLPATVKTFLLLILLLMLLQSTLPFIHPLRRPSDGWAIRSLGHLYRCR